MQAWKGAPFLKGESRIKQEAPLSVVILRLHWRGLEFESCKLWVPIVRLPSRLATVMYK